MSNVIDIDSFKPHFATFDPFTGSGHVIPVDLVKDMMHGKIPIEDVDEWGKVVRALLYSLLLAEGQLDVEDFQQWVDDED